jgi:myo-inositol-1(or 4)-monophosphatase
MSEWKKELESITRMARQAGDALAQHYPAVTRQDVTLKKDSSLLTRYDLESEQLIKAQIKQQYPSDMILAEESVDEFEIAEAEGRRLWIIDPLDGTYNYASGIPIFAVSIALAMVHHQQLKVLVGVVYAPLYNKGTLWSSVAGQGLYCNGVRVVKTPASGRPPFVPSTFIHDHEASLSSLKQALRYSPNFRRLGCASVELSLVAEGKLSGFYELNLRLWDYAAASLFVTESGYIFKERRNPECWHAASVQAGSQDFISCLPFP